MPRSVRIKSPATYHQLDKGHQVLSTCRGTLCQPSCMTTHKVHPTERTWVTFRFDTAATAETCPSEEESPILRMPRLGHWVTILAKRDSRVGTLTVRKRSQVMDRRCRHHSVWIHQRVDIVTRNYKNSKQPDKKYCQQHKRTSNWPRVALEACHLLARSIGPLLSCTGLLIIW